MDVRMFLVIFLSLLPQSLTAQDKGTAHSEPSIVVPIEQILGDQREYFEPWSIRVRGMLFWAEEIAGDYKFSKRRYLLCDGKPEARIEAYYSHCIWLEGLKDLVPSSGLHNQIVVVTGQYYQVDCHGELTVCMTEQARGVATPPRDQITVHQSFIHRWLSAQQIEPFDTRHHKIEWLSEFPPHVGAEQVEP